MEIMTPYFIIAAKLVGALLVGGLLGLERRLAGKTAGLRTYALVSLGSALFIIIAELVGERYVGLTAFDPLRVASQIIVGIGFLGAGTIIFRDGGVSGLTTAAGLWVAAGLGMAMGYGLYVLALMATLLTLMIFTLLWYLEERLEPVNKHGQQ